MNDAASDIIDLFRVSFEPPGPVAEAFLTSNAFVRGIRGPIGSGKSVACCLDLMNISFSQEPDNEGVRRTRHAIIRNTYPELKTTTIKTWHDWFPESIGHWVASGPPTHLIKGKGPDGIAYEIEVLFVALDSPEDVRKVLSMELTAAWMNEAREIPKAILDGLTGRVGRYPPQKTRPAHLDASQWPTFFGVIMDTNSMDDDHWWYTLAEVKTPEGFAFFKQPSGLEKDAENIKNLPTGYYERFMQGKDLPTIDVYVHNKYGFVQDGKPVYHEFNQAVHFADVEYDKYLPLYIGIDWGLTPAATIAQRDIMGQWRFIDEFVSLRMGAKRFREELGKHLEREYPGATIEHITGDPAGDSAVQTNEDETPFSIFNAPGGLHAVPAHTNDFTIRREAMADLLNRLIDGRPAVVFGKKCVYLRKGMAGKYRYKRVQVAGDASRYRDKPDKNEYSHVCEAGQYLLLGGGEGKALTVRQDRAKAGKPKINTVASARYLKRRGG